MPSLAPEHWVSIIVAALAAVGVVTAAALAFLGAWLKARADKQLAQAQVEAEKSVTKAQIDARIDARLAQELETLTTSLEEVRGELDQLKEQDVKKMAAVGRIFRAIVNQWPGDSAGPDLDPSDIRLIESTIPPQWIRSRNLAKET